MTESGLEHGTDEGPDSTDALKSLVMYGSSIDLEIIVLDNDQFALRRGKYFGCAEPNHPLIIFNRNNIGPWETFSYSGCDGSETPQGGQFSLIPIKESVESVTVETQEFRECFKPPLASIEDVEWYEANAIHFFPIGSGIHETSTSISLGHNKILSTKHKAHGVLFDNNGFLNNHGFLYRRQEDFSRLSIDPITYLIRADACDVRRTSRLKGTYLLPFDGNSFNYYHFVIDGLANLIMMKDAGLTYAPILCVDREMLSWQKEYLTLIGQEAVVVVDGENSDLIEVETIYYIKTLELPRIPKHIIRDLAERVKNSAGFIQKPPAFRRRLFIKRKPGQRSLTNLSEVEAHLIAKGFESFDLDGLPVAVQAELFASADIVIGPHGAGLVNLIYCEPGALIIDLIPSVGEVRNFFWLLANKVDVRYGFLRCEANNGYGGELTVDIPKLEKALALIA